MHTITLEYSGESYTVEPDRVMRLIAIIEDIISLPELASGKVGLAKISMAYGAALRYAGAKVTDEAVYCTMFETDAAQKAQGYIVSLLMMMIPPDVVKDKQVAKKPVPKPKKKPA
jgi:hypothetical protein